MDVLTMFGNRLTELRLQRGLTQEELSKRTGFHQSYVRNVERGRENTTLKAISKFSDVLDVPLSTMIDFKSVTPKRG